MGLLILRIQSELQVHVDVTSNINLVVSWLADRPCNAVNSNTQKLIEMLL